MFNSYFSTPVVMVKKVPIVTQVTLVTEFLVQDGDNYVLHRKEGDKPMLDPELLSRAVTPVERAKVGKVSPSATNYLNPSLEFQQSVAATLAKLDDKFSYDAALEKLTQSKEPKVEPSNPE